MRLVKCKPNDIKDGFYRSSKNYKILTDFIDSDMTCALVEGWTNRTASICAASLNASIKTYKLFSIKACSRQGNVYLIKINSEE